MRLYAHNAAAKKAALNALSAAGRALIEMATGLGKTIVMREVARKYKKRILFLCHDTDILTQNAARFAEQFGKDVGLFHGRHKKGKGARIVFTTFQTMLNNLEQFASDAFCLMLVDECHHSPAPTFRQVVDHFTCPRLGATATVERSDFRSVEELFGNPVYSMDLPEAIKRGLLTPFEYHLLSDHLSEEIIDLLTEERHPDTLFSLANLNYRLFIERRDDEVVRIIKEKVGNRKTIVFCRNIEHAIRIAGKLNANLIDKHAASYHSGLFRLMAGERFNDFKEGKLQYLVVVNKLNEGVDIPDVEAVVFLRDTESKTIFFQQLGRSLRKADDKEDVLVLDFVNSLRRIAFVRGLATALGGTIEETEPRELMTVSGDGFSFIFETETLKALDLLETLRNRNFYSYTKARARVQKLGIFSVDEYRERYQEDRYLPAAPRSVYEDEWRGWSIFLGKRDQDFYSYTEAKAQVQEMKILSSAEYQRRRIEDNRLPANPNDKYEDWVGWKSFLGTREQLFYHTYEEAEVAVRRLGIRAHLEYVARYKEDPHLPSNPDKNYSGRWIGWREFLGIEIPYSFHEAREIVRQMHIRGSVDYACRYKEDSRLPGVPKRKYKDDWVSWADFIGRE